MPIIKCQLSLIDPALHNINRLIEIPYGNLKKIAPKRIRNFVPESNLLRRSKNLGLVDEIYNIAELQFCV